MAQDGQPKKAALYLRVSTDQQTVENQERELREAATRHRWEVTQVFADKGISGAKGRDQRPELDRLMRGVARREFDLVAAWSVDRLGRSLQDLITVLGEINAKRVDLYLHQQAIDTTTPAGKALFQMLGVFAEFERAMIQERVRAGLARAKAKGKALGRPKIGKVREAEIAAALQAGKGIRRVAREMKAGITTVLRVKEAMAPTS